LTFADVADTDVDLENLTVTTTGTFAGTYGSLVLNADGSYTYTLNASNAAVNGLDDGETLTDTFNYTASDGTTTASSTLAITIFGRTTRRLRTLTRTGSRRDERSRPDVERNVLQMLRILGIRLRR
jgi:VCBS repeat-containing protein